MYKLKPHRPKGDTGSEGGRGERRERKRGHLPKGSKKQMKKETLTKKQETIEVCSVSKMKRKTKCVAERDYALCGVGLGTMLA